MKTIKIEKRIIIVFIIALLIRIAFDFYFQQFYFGKFVFEYKDSPTYINPIMNLIYHHQYTIYLNVEDAKYFRPPVYPTFLGIIYLIFGKEFFDYGVAIFQAFIDSFSAVLVYLIINKIFNNSKLALISALIYATYPFVIIWNPISYTEILQIFLMFLLIWITISKFNSFFKYFLQGLLITLLTLTKQYMGLLILIPIITYLLDKNLPFFNRIKVILIVILSFSFTMSPWVLRNYIVSGGKIIILKGKSTGLPIYGRDFEAFEKFANLFNQNITPIWDDLSFKDRILLGDKHKEFVSKHKKEIEIAFHLAYKCGPSFLNRRGEKLPKNQLCENQVINNFQKLTKEFWQEVPLYEALETRFESFMKIFTKTNIVNKKIKFSKTDILKRLLFIYRIMLIILGIVSMLYLIFFVEHKYKNIIIAIFITGWSFYIFFSFVIVHTEIRYLLVPDLLFSIFAPYIIFQFRKKHEKN